MDDEEAAVLMAERWATIINQTPFLLSILYDINLLPEQVRTKRDAMLMASICLAYGAGARSQGTAAPE